MYRRTALTAFLAWPLLAACGPGRGRPMTAAATQPVPVEGGGSYTDVNPAGLAAMLGQKDFFFVNVHVPYEGEIEPTDAFVPYDQVDANLALFPQARGAKIVLYCRSGGMSAIAARALVGAGYTNVWNLDGGMVGWEAAGHPLVHRDSPI